MKKIDSRELSKVFKWETQTLTWREMTRLPNGSYEVHAFKKKKGELPQNITETALSNNNTFKTREGAQQNIKDFEDIFEAHGYEVKNINPYASSTPA